MKVLNRVAINKKYNIKQNTKKTQSKKNNLIYTILFFNQAVQFGSRQTSSYKLALLEAERWALSGNGYISQIKWESPIGSKYIELDFFAVKQQRKERIAYRKTRKTNQFQSAYVAL